MNQTKKTAYQNLILKLLVCPGEQLASVLKSNPNLVDAGLVIEMENMSERIRLKTPFEADLLTELAKGLKNYLKFCEESNQNQHARTPIGSDLTKNAFWQFWLKLLQTKNKHQNKSEPVYALLSENLSLLNLKLIPLMEIWLQNSIIQYPEVALDIAAQLENLCINIPSSEQVCVYCKIEEERRRQKPCHRKKREE